MIVILHNIRSLHNVGSIFRTADAAGIEKIYLCGITPAPIDVFGKPRQQLTKVSLGAEKYVEWERVKSTTKLIDKLRRDGYKIPKSAKGGPGWRRQSRLAIFAIEQSKKSIPYYKIPKSYILNSKFCLIFGNEINGLPLSILKRADKILEIPMKGKKESLNVAVAFGIIAFHLIHTYN